MYTNDDLEIAEGFINSEKYPKAIEFLSELISEHPEEYKAFIQRGYAYFCIAEIEKAIADFTHSIELNDKADLAYWYLSQIFSSKRDYSKAKEYIIKAINIKKDNLNYIGDYAFIEQRLKNYKNSIDLCNEILSHYPTDTFALNTRGYGYQCLNDWARAIEDFEKVLIENPDDFLTLNNLGFALCKIGEHKKSYKYFQLAIEIEPRFAYPYDNLGYVYYLDNDYNKALSLISRSIELDPSNSWAYKNRALVYLSQKQNEMAKNDLLKAKELGYTEEYDNEVEELLDGL